MLERDVRVVEVLGDLSEYKMLNLFSRGSGVVCYLHGNKKLIGQLN